MPETAVDFRAPPPSPVTSGRRSSVTNDEVLTEFLESSLRVPDLVLPDKIFPKQKLLETPPKVDFVSLCLHNDDDQCDAVLDAMARIGCFQLVNHGIPREMVASTVDAATGVFDVPAEERNTAVKSLENPWGFEECHGGDEGESEVCEEFVWCREKELKLKMEGIWPIGYPNFSKKMETLISRIETVAEKILSVILKKIPRKFEHDYDDDDMGHHHHGHDIGTLCCVYKHHHQENTSDHGWANSLKYEVIRMLIRGTDYSHSLCLHLCDGSSEFHLYSKKNWLSFSPEQGAIIITIGDQTQVMSDGQYKHVIGRPIFRGEKRDNISMAFLYSTQSTNNTTLIKTDRGRTISLGQQAIFAIILTLLYHILIYVNNVF